MPLEEIRNSNIEIRNNENPKSKNQKSKSRTEPHLSSFLVF